MKLKDLLCRAALGNTTDILVFVEKFTPLLKKYSYLLRYEDAYYDLQLRLLELIPVIANNRQLQHDEQIAVYIKHSIRNEYFSLGKRNAEYIQRQFNLDEDTGIRNQIIEKNSSSWDDYFQIDCSDIFSDLTQSERLAVIGTIVQGYSSATIARHLGCTRQSVNQAKKRGLTKIRHALQLGAGKDNSDVPNDRE